MLFRIVIVCLILAATYAAWQIVSIRSAIFAFDEPLAEFTILQKGNHSAPVIVELLNYDCGFCKDTHLVLLEYAKVNPDIGLVTRPVPYTSGNAELATKMALAAGLQGKFREMDLAIAEYKGELTEKFFREVAALNDIDYDRMVIDANGDDIFDYARDNATASFESGAQSTPAFMIGKRLYELDKPLTMTDLIRMVEQEK